MLNLSLLKVLPDWIYYRGKIARHSLGFIYATDAIGIYLIIILMYFYIKKSKARIEEIILLETINVFLYKMTDGRLSFILITLLLAGLLLSKLKILKNLFKRRISQKIIKITCYILPVVLFISFNLLTYLYSCNNSFAKQVNEILSDRLKYTSEAYENYGIPIFGKNIKWNGWGGYGHTNTEEIKDFKYNFVDSSYAKMIFDNGIIFTVIVIMAYTVTLLRNHNKKNYWLVIAVFFVLIWGVVEQYLFNIGRNIYVLALIPLLETGNIKSLEYNNIKRIKGKINEKINR